MKKLIIVFSILIPLFAQAQSIQNFGLGTNDFNSSGTGYIRKVFVDSSDNSLYAGGNFLLAGGIPCYGIAKWSGGTWDSLSSGTYPNPGSSITGSVLDIEKFGEDLIISGLFTKVGGKSISGIAKWDGNEWFSVGGSTGGSVLQMEVYQNELYVVGNFVNIGGIQSNGIAKWDGQRWIDLSQNFNINCDNINASKHLATLIHFNGVLHVAGNINCSVTSEERIYKLVGTQWVQVGPDINGNAWINKLCIYQNRLYVGGYFVAQGNNIDNNIFSLVGNVAYSTSGGVTPWNVFDMFEHKNELYVCGQISIAGGDSVGRIAKWNGTQWINTGISIKRSNMNPNFGQLHSFTEYNGKLVMGGGFDMINESPVFNIAMVDFGNVGVNNLEKNSLFKLYPNPTNSNFSIELANFSNFKSVSVYNSLGQLLLQQKTPEKTFDVSNYAKGMYVVEVQTDKGISRQKLIVE